MLLIPPANLDVPGLGTVHAGVPVDVPDQMAGHPADPRREAAMREHALAVAAIDHIRASELREEIIGLDMGAGLLAQGWEPADAGADTPTTFAVDKPSPTRRRTAAPKES
jgi:hypothetical protein